MPIKDIILLRDCLSGHLVRYNSTYKSCSSDLLQHWREEGRLVTHCPELAAWLALKTAQSQGCRFAIMTDGSPTCGSQNVYDGASSGVKVPGEGVAAALLRQHGIENPRVLGSIPSPGTTHL
nr:2-thiouracil desulfurase family protein [Enterobacter kobei]